MPVFVDFDGDGDLDVILVKSFTGIFWLSNIADAVVSMPTVLEIEETTLLAPAKESAQVYTMEVADFDNDEDLDLVVWLRTSNVTSLVLFENVDNTFARNRSLELESIDCCAGAS